MGFLLWAALTALAVAAGLAVAGRVGSRLPVGERLVAAGVTAVSLVLGSIQALGYAGALYPWTVAGAVAGSSTALIVLCRGGQRGRPPGPALRAAARAALGTKASLLITAAAAALTFYLAAMVWLLPSWGFDAMWYHDAISAYALQEHSLAWVGTHVPFINSYPKNVELLALWNVLFAPDDRLLDGAQLPLAWLGVLALACMVKRGGAAPPLAWALGCLWLWVPAVLLNIPSNYVDVGAAALWMAAALFLARWETTAASNLFGALALGCYLGSKVSALLHAALLAPLLAWVAFRETRRIGAASVRLLGMGAVTLALGGATYLRDWVRFGNPLYPARVELPFGGALNGFWPLSSLNTPPFGGSDDLEALLHSWADFHPFWFVDVRTGGFGPLFLLVLLPLCGVVLFWAPYERLGGGKAKGTLAIAVLFVTAFLTPARWWARYTLGFPAAGLLAAGWVLARLKSPLARQRALAALGVAAVVQALPARSGWRAPPGELKEAWSLPAAARAHLRHDVWQQEQIAEREARVKPGEASIYDDSVSFIYQLWRYDWKNRVLYRPLEGDVNAWRSQLAADHARWAAVRPDGSAAQALKDEGWKELYPCVAEGCRVWVKP